MGSYLVRICAENYLMSPKKYKFTTKIQAIAYDNRQAIWVTVDDRIAFGEDK